MALPSLALVAAQPAAAHATLQSYGSSYTEGSYGQMFVRIPHACSDSTSTTKIEVNLPASFTAIKPQQKASWSASTSTAEDGSTVVTWDGGSLPNNLFDDFGLSVKFPEESGKYTVPVVQTCDDGGTVAWTQVPEEGMDSHSLRYPAPSVMVEPKASSAAEYDTTAAVVKKGKNHYLVIDAPITNMEDKAVVRWNGKKLVSVKLDDKGDAVVKLSRKVVKNYAKGGVLKVSANKETLFETTVAPAGHGGMDHSGHGGM